LSLLAFVVVLGVCVIAHEWGHFITARIFGVQVFEFSFGMGPRLWKKKGALTEWSLRVFPIGGFVRLAGMEGKDAEAEEPYREGMGFCDKPAWQRFFILFNGAAVNILLAILLTVLLLVGHGVLDLSSARIGGLIEGYPAQEAGIREGDVILSVGDVSVATWEEMAREFRSRGTEDSVEVRIDRGGEILGVSVRLKKDEETGYPLFGVRPSWKRYSFFAALRYSVEYIWEMTKGIVGGVASLFYDQAARESVTGPVGIASMAGQAARQGLWAFLSFLAVINLHLGVLNLFPFPALDGGRLVFVVGEMLFRRKILLRYEYYIHLAGFALLMGLILLVTWKDLARLFP